MDVWEMTAAERAGSSRAAGRALEDEQWAAESLCAGWTVRDVTGHILAVASMSTGKFFGGMIRNRFSFERLQQEGAQRQTENRTNAGAGGRPPGRSILAPSRRGPATTALGETLVHGEDIFRARWGGPSPTPSST